MEKIRNTRSRGENDDTYSEGMQKITPCVYFNMIVTQIAILAINLRLMA